MLKYPLPNIKKWLCPYNNTATSHTSVTATPIIKDRMAARMVHAFRAEGCFDHSTFSSQKARTKNRIAIMIEYMGIMCILTD